MWATGTGADVMKRLAAPMVGGVCSAMLLTLFVIPAIYVIWRWQRERRETQMRPGAMERESTARLETSRKGGLNEAPTLEG